MVFARTKLVLEDNCFEEDPGAVVIRLDGPNISKMYRVAYELMKSVFNVTDSDIQETDYQWGKSGKSDKVSVNWWIHKDMDLFSYLYIRFQFKAKGTPEQGNINMMIRGYLRSEYPQDTVWQRSLFYEMLRTFWHRMFYHKKREEYAEECRHMTVIYQRKFIEYFRKMQQAVEEHGKTGDQG